MSALFGKKKKKAFRAANLNVQGQAPAKKEHAPRSDPKGGDAEALLRLYHLGKYRNVHEFLDRHNIRDAYAPAVPAWQSEMEAMDEILRKRGLWVRPVDADGNCFFRAVSDQLGSDEHEQLREQCVDFMAAHHEDFEAFVEAEDGDFESYCSQMRELKTWAGQLEIQAMARILGVNVVIRRLDEPSTEIINFGEGARCLHLSYHSGEHYNSVRELPEDASEGPTGWTVAAIRAWEKEGEAQQAAELRKAAEEASAKAKYGNMTELKLKR